MPRKCPVCGCLQHTCIRQVHMVLPHNVPLPNQYNIVACDQCGFCYADTSATQADYDTYYSSYNNYSGQGENKTFETTFAPIGAFLREKVPLTSSVLDIGFGKGELLVRLRKLGYTQLVGLDPSQDSVSNLRAQGIEAYCKSIYDESAELSGHFDLVFMTSVLEHLLDPKTAIMCAGSYLKDSGYLIIDIPDYAQCDKVDLPIPNQFNQEHINYFSEDSFISLVSTTNFRVLKSETIELKGTNGLGAEYSRVFMLQKSAAENHKVSIRKDSKTRKSIECYLFSQEKHREKTVDTINELYIQQTPLLIWGSGALAMSLLGSTQLSECNIIAFVDGNPLKAGTEICNRTVIAPDKIKRYPNATIAICAMKYAEEIKRTISELAVPNQVVVFT